MQVTPQRQKPSWTMLAAFNFGTNTGKAVSGLYPGLMVNKAQDKKKKSAMRQHILLFSSSLLHPSLHDIQVKGFSSVIKTFL